MHLGQILSLLKATRRSPLRRALQADADFFLPVLTAVIVYLAAVCVAAMLVLSPPTAQQDNRLIVQLPSPSETRSSVQSAGVILPKILALPGVAKVDALCLPFAQSPLLQQIVNADPLAPAVPLTGLAVPLTGLAVEVGAESADAVTALRQRLLAELPDAQVISANALAAAALRPIHAIRGLMLVILGLLVATLCASVGFSMGGRVKPTGEAVNLLHSLGADESTMVRVIVLNAVWSALWAAVSGTVAALFSFAIVAGLGGVNFVANAASILQSGTLWALILILPVGAVALVAVSAWLFARRTFAATP